MSRTATLLVGLLALTTPLPGGVVISEIHYHPPSTVGRGLDFIEIHNPDSVRVELDGWQLRGGIQFTFPPGTAMEPGGHLVVCKDCTLLQRSFGGSSAGFAGEYRGCLDNSGEMVELVDRFNALVDTVTYDDREPWPEAADGQGASLQRLCSSAPARDPLNWSASGAPTPTLAFASRRCPPPPYQSPPVVINEIHYHPRAGEELHPALLDGEDEEFLELKNPGGSPVDLSGWSLADGVQFQFPPGTILPAGGFLVVCRNEEFIRNKFGITNTVGNYTGKLSNRGERVALLDAGEQLVDSALYADAGDWSPGADGLGRSLERIAASRPGTDPANWQASTLTSTYRSLEAEGGLEAGLLQLFVLAIDGPGEILVDNVVCEDLANPGVNLLTNGSFDFVGIEGWTALGIMAGSVYSRDMGVGGSGALKLISRGFCPDGGCTQINSVVVPLPFGLDTSATYRVRVEYKYLGGSVLLRAGVLGGVSVSLGQVVTPGKENTGPGDKPPPFISHVNRFPLEPMSDDPTWITAHVDSSGSPEVVLVYNKGDGEVSLTMKDDGLRRDGAAGDRVFGVELPAFPHNTPVRYRIRASEDGRSGEYPHAASPGFPFATDMAGYYVNDLQEDLELPVYNIILDGVDGADPEHVNLHLNCRDLKNGSFAVNGELYPSVGIRWRGNTACVIHKRNFKVRFNRGRLFRELKKLNLNGLYTDKSMLREHLSWELLREIGIPYCKTEFVRVHLNGEYFGLYLDLEHPDERFLRRNGLNAGGNLYKALQPFNPRNAVGVEELPDIGTYRALWELEANEGGDFTDLLSFIERMHENARSPGGPTREFWEMNSFEDMITGYQLGQVLLNNLDSFAKNHFLYHDLRRDRWGFLTWDLDLTFGKYFNPDATGEGRPVGTLNDYMLSDFQADLNPWFGATVAGNQLYLYLIDFFFRAGGGYYRHAYLIRLWDLLQDKYNNEVYDPRMDALFALLSEEELLDRQFWGRYPSNVQDFPADMESNIEIMKNQIRLHRNSLVSYLEQRYPEIPSHPRVKITEIMYLPEEGDADLEFLEFLNPDKTELDISGWTTSGVTYTFDPGTIIAPRERFILARSPGRFRQRYTDRSLPQVFGPYTGKLANEGEKISISDAGPRYPALIDFLEYDNQGDWPSPEPGYSLELKPTAEDLDNDNPENWTVSREPGGTPGEMEPVFIRADSDRDTRVILADPIFTLNYLFFAGEEPPCLDSADADDNGRVDVTDAIYTLTHLFIGGSEPPPPYPDPGVDPTGDKLDCR